MAQRWYKKASVQAASVIGLFTISSTILAAFLTPWGQSLFAPKKAATEEVPPRVTPILTGPSAPAVPLYQHRKNKKDTMPTTKRPKLWITYAWKDNAGGNFDFLVQKLEAAGIDTTFDKVALIPGQRLWNQIAARIEDPQLDGWAILLTRESVNSEPCKEELSYALDRTLKTKGQSFPLLGLVHQLDVEQLPAPLRVRLLIDLRNPQWENLVLAGLTKTVPGKTAPATTRYTWKSIPDFRGLGTLAIQVSPRFGELRFWRFLYPKNTNLIDWGSGPPQKLGFTGPQQNVVKGGSGTLTSGDFAGESITWLGAGDVVTPGGGCYIVFGTPLPQFIAFGVANEPFGDPAMETVEFARIR